jgi:futalosine hydrolase
MLRILLISATSFEIEPTFHYLKHKAQLHNVVYHLPNYEVSVCISGVGMINTAFELGKLAGQKFDVAINAGIAGSFGKHSIGEVVNVTQDCLSELGAENGERFLSLDDLGFGKQHLHIQQPFQHLVINMLPQVSGITVNTVHGNDDSIKKIIERYKPDVESMEGAAFIHAANAFGWPSLQLRAISNLVEKRNRENWNIPLAIENLNKVVIELLKTSE